MRVSVLVAALVAVTLSAPEVRSAAAGPPSCVDVAADARSAVMAARACGHRVEVMDARTDRTRVLINPDGTSTMESSVLPRWVRRADGTWSAIDTSLRLVAGEVAPVATAADVRFSAGGQGPLVTLRQAGRTFSLSWPAGPLPVPVLAGDTATYRSVLPGVDLVVRATVTGFSHVLVVHDRAASRHGVVRSARYRVGGDVQLVTTPTGGLLVRAGRATVARADGALMWDSSGGSGDAARAIGAGAAGPGEGGRQAPVRSTMQGADLVLTPDAPLLDDPAAVYPIVVDPGFQTGRSTWAYATDNNENGPTTDPNIQSGDPYPAANEMRIGNDPASDKDYRGFLQFPTVASGHDLRGKHIISAYLHGRYDHTWKNGSNISTYFYRTDGISTSPRQSWPGPVMRAHLGSYAAHANEDCCGEPNVPFDMADARLTADLQYAANNWWGSYTIGISAGSTIPTGTGFGSGETIQDRWSRFFLDEFVLVATYNTVPGVPANLTTAGAACGSVVGTTSPKLKAQYVDGDGSDTLNATFEWKQLPSGTPTPVAGPAKPANNFGEITLPLGAAAEGKSYSWRLRTQDAYDTSPWSPWCDLTVNASAPPMPVVTASVYKDDGVAHGGPGISGSFTFSQPVGDPRGQDVVSYVYGWTDPPSIVVTVAPGASKTLTLTPPEHGLNTLYVYSKDTAGTPGPTKAYQFLVGAPSAPVAHWPLDTIDGHNYQDMVGSADLTPTGGVSWLPDSRFIGASAASFPGSEHLATAGPMLDTTKSFSIAAWARLADTTSTHTVVSQLATSHARFYLYYSSTEGAWALKMYDEDGLSTAGAIAVGTAPVAGEWTHLLGVYDVAEKRISLYVNGVLTDTEAHTPVWSATGPMVIGRKQYDAMWTQSFQGEIADVRVWQRVVVPDDLWGTDADPAAGTQATAGVLAPTEVGSWDFAGGVDCGCSEALDGSYFGRSLELNGWDATPPVSGFTGDGHDGNDALWLNHPGPGGTGTAGNGYAATTGPVLRTDQSFTVSAWVRPAEACTSDRVMLSQLGVTHARFILYCSWSTNRWRLYLYNEDTTSTAGNGATSISVPVVGEWTHLVGVFDAGANRIRLYVNGALEASSVFTAAWQAQGGLNLGRTVTSGSSVARFRGDVDHVRLFAGAMSDREVKALHNS